MDILFGASILASFLAGLVALFAPCCVTVVLPTFLASALKRREQIVLQTLIFFAGLAAVLVPIALGVSTLASFFRDFHRELYLVGGLLMLLFGLAALRGLKLPWSFHPRLVPLDPGRPASVFTLGVFSGAATACCVPVLAGALTLSVLSGSFLKALAVSLSYVAGMVFPLLLAAFFYDRFNLADSRFLKSLAAPRLSAAIFFLLGIVFILMGTFSGGYWTPNYQVAIGEYLNRWSTGLFAKFAVVPDPVWGVLILLIFVSIIAWSYRSRRAETKLNHSCCDHNDKDKK